MARITIGDCTQHVSKYHLVRLAALRARQLIKGDNPAVDPQQDRPTVVALREIAQGIIPEEKDMSEPEFNWDEEEGQF